MSPNKIYSRANVSSCARTCLNTRAFYSSLLFFSAFFAQTFFGVVNAQSLTCPSGFTLGSESESTYTCVFEQTLQNPVGEGESPSQSTEGATLIADARAVCRGADGTPRNARDVGTTGVAMDCVFEKPPEDPVPVDPVPSDPVPSDPDPSDPDPSDPDPSDPDPTDPDVIDFDLSSTFQPGSDGNPGGDDGDGNGPGSVSLEASVATSMAGICNGFLGRDDLTSIQQDLLDRCLDINAESNEQIQFEAVQKVAAQQYGDIANLINFQNTIMVGEIGNRLASLREIMSQTVRDVAINGELQHPSPGLLANSSTQRGGAAGDDDSFFNRFGAFVFGSQGDGEKSTTDISQGFDYESSTATIGIDYLVNNSTIVGVASGYGSSRSVLVGGAGDINIRNNSISVYGSKYFKNGWYLDAVGGVGNVDSRNRRSIDFTANGVTIEQDAFGKFDADQSIISVGGGRSYEGFVNVDVSARVNHIETAIDRFSETIDPGAAGFGLALEIDSYDLVSTTSDVSIGVSKSLSQSWGVLVPSATLRWLHEFEGGDDFLFGRFLADPTTFDFRNTGVALGFNNTGSTIFAVPLEKIDADYGNLLLGVTALFPNQLSVNFRLNRTIGLDNFDHTYYSLTLRRDFN